MKDVAEVGAGVLRERVRRGMSLRAAAEEIGTSANTLMRLEVGENVGSEVLLKALRWLGDGDPFAMGYRTGREAALAEATEAVRGIRA